MYKKILVAVDGSELSFRALESAKALAQATGGELALLHVENDAPEHAQHKRIGLVSEGPAASCTMLLNKILEAMNGSAVKYKLHTVNGKPAEVILSVAKENGCDTIVMGSRGLGSFTKLFLGSVSSEVINKADIPVVIIK